MVRARGPTALGYRAPQPVLPRTLLATLPALRQERTAILFHSEQDGSEDHRLAHRRNPTRAARDHQALCIQKKPGRNLREARIRLAAPGITRELPPPTKRALPQDHPYLPAHQRRREEAARRQSTSEEHTSELQSPRHL